MTFTTSYDVVVVGAGAAGLAAGRRLMAAGLEVLVLEARERIGGRAATVPTPLGTPIDLGCEWLHHADRNPWTGIARELGFAIDETLPDWGRRVAWLSGETAEREWDAARADFDQRCEQAAAGAADLSAAALLPPGGRWNALLGAISTWANGAELERLSVKDRDRYADSEFNWRVLEGYGALIAAYGAHVPVRLGTAVERIDHSGRAVMVATSSGDIRARAAIITLPTNLIAAEAIRFVPALPEKIAAAAGLPLGIANKLFLALDGAADDLPQDRHLVGSTERVETGSYQLRPHGWPIIAAYYGGAFAGALEAAGSEGMAAFALEELAVLLGSRIKSRLKPLASSVWVADPFARGSYSCALPGHADDRAALAAPVDDRLFFAGEACSRDYFGTAHGAFISGVAAADQSIAALGATIALP
jgi:monoamine oxidase